MLEIPTAQAIIRWLSNQFIEIDGEESRVCGGGFGIFGHGNVTCLGEALNCVREELPLYRGQNEQSMGFAAAGYAKQWLRQRFMFCTASTGPGASNLLTSAALDPYEGWTNEGHGWWECGTPQVSERAAVRAAHEDWEPARARQRQGA